MGGRLTMPEYPCAQLNLKSWPPGFSGMPFNSFITCPSRSGSKYKLTLNQIQNGRGRGAIVRGSGGLISGNKISYVAFEAINMTPGFDATREGGFPKNVQVCSYLLCMRSIRRL
jgi:hypothetical protein